MNIKKMKLAHRFATLLIILITGFVMYGAWSFHVLGNLKVNGPVYQRIVQGKDLIADILPPPEYIIESYLVSLQAMNAEPAERPALIKNLQSLKNDYDTRHTFWAKEDMDDALKDQLLVQADGPARQFYQVAFDQFVPALEKGDNAAAATALGQMKQHYAKHRAAIDKLVEMATKRNAADEENARAEIAQSNWTMLTILLSVMGVASVFLWRIAHNLIRQLGSEPGYAADIAQKIAAGDLAVQIDTRTIDQSSLLFAIKTMRDSLAAIVVQVRAGTDTITAASAQIASGNLELSSRTELQAGSLEETASSMEELTGTVRQNADHVLQANQLAISASEVALKGGSVVSEVVDTMGAINDSAKKIVDIISVIDGIAFQTNILALNAAVEAARAGEQGRGFAVVAAEVRTLAQRSATAAKEIKGLIGNSVEEVDKGAKLVDQAGTTMREIVESVKRVTDIISEIAAANREQEAGIEQVNQAITEIDGMTQQNAALVEEAAAAAGALQEQAGTLAQVVNVFKLDDASPARLAPLAVPVANGNRALPSSASLTRIAVARSKPRVQRIEAAEPR